MEGSAFFLKKIVTKFPVLMFDVFAIPLAWFFAYWLQANLRPSPGQFISFESLSALCVLSVIQIVCFYHFKVYRGLWKFSSLNDVSRIIRAVLTATLFVLPVLYMASIMQHIPRSILPLYDMLLVMFLCGARLLLRSYWDKYQRDSVTGDVQRVLILGAGAAGESLIRDLKHHPSYLILGFLDDDLTKRGMDVHGVRVFGRIQELEKWSKHYGITLILIAIPSASSAEMRRVVTYCEQSNIPFRTLPSLQALVSGRIEMNALREVRIEDLLGRDQVTLHWERIAEIIQKKRVLVTGAGGSIGSELCRQILALEPQQLVMLDNNEYNLYKIDMELREQFPKRSIEVVLASVVDRVAIEHVFHRYKPEIVFHAAAYKHVPLLESQVRVAAQNNILGTQCIAEASVALGVEKFILISTDKAVNPTNIMGTTKRIAEIYCQNLNARVSTQLITVRFGNVLGSVGSVVPLFQKQLQKGGPLTVTHPDIERYFMTISEASQLILQAMADGEGGEIFVLDMGEPLKISYLAEQMIRLAGKEPGKDVEIVYTGLRPGEKLFEELFHASEQLVETSHEKLFKAQFRYLDWKELTEALRMLENACKIHENDEILIILKNLVPEFLYDLERADRVC